jgi:hypothetical protein
MHIVEKDHRFQKTPKVEDKAKQKGKLWEKRTEFYCSFLTQKAIHFDGHDLSLFH